MQKKSQLLEFERLPAAEVEKFISALRQADDWNLFRINPFSFAGEHAISPDIAIDLFIHAARIGLVDFNYNMICPRCGGVARSHHELDAVEATDFYCALCTASTPTTLDDQVEVSFAINPSVHKVSLNPLESLESYNRYHFSANYVISPELAALRKKLIRHLLVVAPGKAKRIHLSKGRYRSFQLVSIETNTSITVHLERNDGSIGKTGSIAFGVDGFTQKELSSTASQCEITVHNSARTPVGMMLSTPDLEQILKVVADHPTQVKRFLTAKMLLNNQTFRELFKVQHLSTNLNLNIRSLTIMFTDLRGSTEMYDRAGDVFAYSLVQEHFRILTDCARKYQGAIIKTMGDAIMATFSTPADGMFAALDMMREIAAMNDRVRRDGFEIGLKVGLHEGPALAVMRDERLDYFGQTVNIAARVQGLASAGEIWVTQSVADAPAARAAAEQAKLSAEQHRARLKGVGQETLVYKFSAA